MSIDSGGSGWSTGEAVVGGDVTSGLLLTGGLVDAEFAVGAEVDAVDEVDGALVAIVIVVVEAEGVVSSSSDEHPPTATATQTKHAIEGRRHRALTGVRRLMP
jgi:hypothetical protein